MKPDVPFPKRHEPPRLREWDVRLLFAILLKRARRNSRVEPLIDRRAS